MKSDVPKCRSLNVGTAMDLTDDAPTLELRASAALADLLQRTSNAPARHEMESAFVRFAREFGFEVGFRLVRFTDNDDAAFAVRSAVDRAAKGEL